MEIASTRVSIRKVLGAIGVLEVEDDLSASVAGTVASKREL